MKIVLMRRMLQSDAECVMLRRLALCSCGCGGLWQDFQDEVLLSRLCDVGVVIVVGRWQRTKKKHDTHNSRPHFLRLTAIKKRRREPDTRWKANWKKKKIKESKISPNTVLLNHRWEARDYLQLPECHLLPLKVLEENQDVNISREKQILKLI